MIVDDPIPIEVPPICQKHQTLLVKQLGLGPDDPWRAHVIGAQIVLFQGVTVRPGFWERLAGDIQRLPELGCLACYAPDTFGEIVAADQQGGLGAVKALGERLVKAGTK